MHRVRFSISRAMAATAILGVNIGVVRAFLLYARDPHDSVFLMFFALQVGLWRYLRTGGRRRRFWLGFEVSGLAATVAVSTLVITSIDLNNWYTGVASDLCDVLPARVEGPLMGEYWDGFLVVAYFVPEFLAATLGGLLTACLFKARNEKVDTALIAAPPAP